MGSAESTAQKKSGGSNNDKSKGAKRDNNHQHKQSKKRNGPAERESAVILWGNGTNGQLGLGERATSSTTPTSVQFFLRIPIVSVSCGASHTAFLTDGGTVFMCGQGANNRLGTGNDQDLWTPTVLPFSEEFPVQQVACGPTFTIFLTKQGQIYSCGAAKKGALGLDEISSARKPTRVVGLNRIIKIAAGSKHVLAMTSKGEVYSWGDPAEGVLGHGPLDYSQRMMSRQGAPKLMENEYVSRHRFIDIACGSAHTALLNDKGEVFCCGRGEEGQIGYGGKQEHWFPRKIEITVPLDPTAPPPQIDEDDDETPPPHIPTKQLYSVRVFCGAFSTSAITLAGEVFVWGDSELYPTQILTENKVVQVAPHATNGMILTEENKVLTYAMDELAVSDQLVAKEIKWDNAPPICYIACGEQHFACIRGSTIPDLTGDRQAILSYNTDARMEKQFQNTRAELFKTTEKRTKGLFDKDAPVSGTNHLDKMKEELFSTPSKIAAAQAASDNRQTVISQKPSAIKGSDFDDIDDFKRALLGDSAIPSPAASKPVSRPATTQPVVSEREALFSNPNPKKPVLKLSPAGAAAQEDARAALFATKPKKVEPVEPVQSVAKPPKQQFDDYVVITPTPEKTQPIPEVKYEPEIYVESDSESGEEFVDELPQDSTLYDRLGLRPTEKHFEEPPVEAFSGVDLLDDEDLL